MWMSQTLMLKQQQQPFLQRNTLRTQIIFRFQKLNSLPSTVFFINTITARKAAA